MPKFSVLFDVRHFNGCLHVFAENAEKAQEMIENEDIDKLRRNCDDVAVEVEGVEELKELANEANTD